MANSIINTVPVDSKNKFTGQFSIEDYALTFVYGMGKNQRERFKKMLEQNINCGESVAYNYGIDYEQFIKEIKRLLKVEEK